MFIPIALASVQLGTAKTIRVPEEHKTIQAGIDAAEDGDSVLVSAGRYHEQLSMKTGVTVISAGGDERGEAGLLRAEKTVLDGGGAAGPAGVTMSESATLDGFTVTNVGKYDDALWTKHHATQGEQQAHEHIGAPGIPGVAITGVTCVVRNNIVHHNGYSGIAITSVDGKKCSPLVTGNTCYRNMGAGIGSMHGSRATIADNLCYENYFAGIGHNGASPTVTGNTCHSNIRAGIGISEGSSPIVRANRCYRNRRAGIGVRTGANTQPLVEENQCYENDMAGIGSEEEARPIIRNNKCYKNKLAGIGSRGGARPTLIGNECFENVLAGIGLSDNVTALVVGNHSHHNQLAGIGFAACESGSATVADNRFVDNKTVAAGIHGGWKVHFSGNTLSRKGGMPPIVMVFEGAEATFIANTINGGGVAAFRVAGTLHADHNKLLGESVRKAGPPNFAVWALEGADVRLCGNEIRSWRHAIVADRARVDATRNHIRDFHGEAFVVRDPIEPSRIEDNDIDPGAD